MLRASQEAFFLCGGFAIANWMPCANTAGNGVQIKKAVS